MNERRGRGVVPSIGVIARWVACICVVAAASAPVTWAEPTDPSGTAPVVEVSGDVERALTLTVQDLMALPTRVEQVTFETSRGSEHHEYVGTSVDGVITLARPVGNPSSKHPLLAVAVLAVGADGYAAALAWSELSSEMSDRTPLVAWSQDGVTLERPRLVVPNDVVGARYVRDLVRLQVTTLAPN